MSADEHQGSTQPSSVGTPLASPPLNLIGKLRLLLAVAMTGALPACWLFLFAKRMEIPLKTSGWVFLGILLAAVAAIPLLCSGLLKQPGVKRIVGAIALLVFGAVFTGIVVTHLGESLPFWQLWGFLFTAAFWTFGVAWFLTLIKNKIVAAVVIVGLVAWGMAAPSFLKFDGLTGDARAKFAWSFLPEKTTAPYENVADSPQTAPLSVPKLDPLDFPGFLGNRQGNLVERPFATDWENSPPQQIWKKPVGKGWSSFALIGDLGITLEQRDQQETVVCYRLSTGEELWKHADETRFNGALGGDGPRTTPAIDGDRVYTIGATGLLRCLDLATGKKRWGIDVLADNGGKDAYHGMCGSPLVVDQMVIVSPTGGAEFSLTAYDKLAGERLWRSGKWAATYSSPMFAKLKGVEQILIHNNKGVESHALGDGSLLWSYEWTNNENTVCSQPVLVPGKENQVLLSIGYGKGSVLLEIDGKAGGEWSAEPLWTSKEMKTKFTTAVIREDYVYGLDDGILACIDLKTGKRKWKGGRYKHGQLLLVGEWLVIQAEDGEVVLVRANPKKLEEVGRLPALTDKTWNNPALNRDYLVVRNDREAICFRVSPTEAKASSP